MAMMSGARALNKGHAVTRFVVSRWGPALTSFAARPSQREGRNEAHSEGGRGRGGATCDSPAIRTAYAVPQADNQVPHAVVRLVRIAGVPKGVGGAERVNR